MSPAARILRCVVRSGTAAGIGRPAPTLGSNVGTSAAAIAQRLDVSLDKYRSGKAFSEVAAKLSQELTRLERKVDGHSSLFLLGWFSLGPLALWASVKIYQLNLVLEENDAELKALKEAVEKECADLSLEFFKEASAENLIEFLQDPHVRTVFKDEASLQLIRKVLSDPSAASLCDHKNDSVCAVLKKYALCK